MNNGPSAAGASANVSLGHCILALAPVLVPVPGSSSGAI